MLSHVCFRFFKKLFYRYSDKYLYFAKAKMHYLEIPLITQDFYCIICGEGRLLFILYLYGSSGLLY